jgi:hypothetical protein
LAAEYLFSQAPGWKRLSDAESFGAELRESLEGAGLAVEQVLAEHVGNGFVAGVVAQRTRS